MDGNKLDHLRVVPDINYFVHYPYNTHKTLSIFEIFANQSGLYGLPSAVGIVPEKNASIDFIPALSSAQLNTDSCWAIDITNRVKIIKGNGATWKT